MKTFKTQRRLAAQVLGTGENKVWFDPERLKDIQEALTKADMEELIKDNAIKAKETIKRKKARKKSKRRGTGRIKKKIKTRKQDYIKKIRKLRLYIKYLKQSDVITKSEYYELRKLAKAGQFRNTRHLKEYIIGVLKKPAKKTQTTKTKTKSKARKTKAKKK